MQHSVRCAVESVSHNPMIAFNVITLARVKTLLRNNKFYLQLKLFLHLAFYREATTPSIIFGQTLISFPSYNFLGYQECYPKSTNVEIWNTSAFWLVAKLFRLKMMIIAEYCFQSYKSLHTNH